MDDVIKLDLRKMVVKVWRKRALDRIEWASVMGKPKPKIKGCCAKGGEEEEEFRF
jgi:hypothetical protein